MTSDPGDPFAFTISVKMCFGSVLHMQISLVGLADNKHGAAQVTATTCSFYWACLS